MVDANIKNSTRHIINLLMITFPNHSWPSATYNNIIERIDKGLPPQVAPQRGAKSCSQLLRALCAMQSATPLLASR